MTKAYCVAASDGSLFVSTCHSHARGAMVNWLWLSGYTIDNGMPDEQIREMFCALASRLETQLVVVNLTVSDDTDARTVPLLATPA